MDNLILKYLESLKYKNLSNNTLDAYSRDIKAFAEFIAERNENLIDVNEFSLMAYVQKLRREGMANSSIARITVSIRRFYKYLIRIGLTNNDPTVKYENIKIKRNIPCILTVEEVDNLLSMPDLTTSKGVRDKAMLEVMYAAGIRVSELVKLTIYNVNLDMKYIICSGSNQKERIIPIGSYAVECLKQYLNIRDELNVFKTDLVFLNLRGAEMTRQGFWKIVKGYAKKANIDKPINLYTLRHSFAVHLLQNGADLKSVQELLGHTDITATQIYLAISKKNKIAEVYKKAHPRA